MADHTPATLSALLKSLSLTDDTVNHAEILKHAQNILIKNPSHPEALHTKVVALLHLDKFDEVVKTLEKTPLEEAKFELAYALYKSGKWEKAEEAARDARERARGEKMERGLRHVEAQAAHRAEHFGRAMEIYKSLIESGKEFAQNEDFDLRVNRNATEAQMVWKGEAMGKRKFTVDELSQFETTYNAACIHIARNEFPQGLMLLKKAQLLCEGMDLSPEDLKEEVAPVIAQQIYALLKMGNVAEVAKASQELDIKTVSDAALKYIASNNSLSHKSKIDPNPHLTLRLYEACVLRPLFQTTVKPYQFQSRILSRNRLSLDLQVGKYGEVKSEVAKSQDLARSAYEIAASCGGRSVKEILQSVKRTKNASTERKDDIALGLYATQLHMELRDITGAIETVEGLLEELSKKEGPEDKYPPALIGLLVALYRFEGRKKAPKKLDEAAQYWKDQPRPNESLILSSTLHSLTSHSQASLESAASFLTSINQSTTFLPPQILSAGIVAACAITKPELAASHLSSLPPIDQLLKGINVDELEAAGVYNPSKKRTADEVARGAKAKKLKSAPVKAKRVRKSMLPKDYIAGKEVDKERWLPLRDRSYYKPPKGGKKDKRRNVAQGGTQGGKVEEEKDQVMADMPVAKTGGGGGGGGGGQAKKKKKKGGKW